MLKTSNRAVGTTLLTVFVAISCFVTSGCPREYDFEREQADTQTLGHELFVIWKKDAERAPDKAVEKTQMLDQNYVAFVDAVDAIAPEDQLAAVDRFLQNLLRVVDEGILPALTRRVAILLEEAISNQELMAALATPTGPDAETFVDPASAPNLAGYASGYPDLPDLLGMVARIVDDNDGFSPEGRRVSDEPEPVTNITRSIVQELRKTEEIDSSLASTIRDLALAQDPRYTADDPLPEAWVVLYDDRGYPKAATESDGTIRFPFVDEDQDGLADLTPDGQFVFRNGRVGELLPFTRQESIEDSVVRDELGRAVLPGGEPVFEYIDLHNTGLGFLIREFRGLSNEDTLYDMLVAFQSVMGPTTVHTDDFGAYEGFSNEHPLAELSRAVVKILDVEELPDIMNGLALLLEEKPEVIAELIAALDGVVAVLDRFPEARLDDDQTLVYDLIPYLQEVVANPALFRDVLWALRQPVSTKTGEAMATLLRFSDNDTVPEPDGPYDACFHQCEATHSIGTLERYDCIRACPTEELFSEPMNFKLPESERDRSLLQKFLHLVRDTAGVEYRMDILEASTNGNPLPELPPLIALPGAGEAFLSSVAGNLDLANYVPPEVWTSDLGELLTLLGVDAGNVASLLSTLSPLFGAELDREPRPHQITRLFNQPQLRFETENVVLEVQAPVCRDNYVMSQHLAYGLFIGEASGTIDTIHPLAVAFSNNDAESTLAGMFGVLHDHYAQDASLYKTRTGAPSRMKAANLRSYEEALEQILSNDDLFVALHRFALAVEEVDQTSETDLEDDLRRFLENALEDGFTPPNSEPLIVIDDGRTIQNPSAMHRMVHAVGEASERLQTVPETRQRLRDAVGNVVDVAIGAEKDTNGLPRFKRSGSPALVAHATRYLAQRAAERQARGDFSRWINEDVLELLEDLWTSRFMFAVIELASNTLENDADKARIDNFVDYLFNSHEGRTHVLVALHQLMVASINLDVWLPVAQFLADAIDPDRDWGEEAFVRTPTLSLGALILQKTLEYDPENTGIFLIHRGLERPSGGQAPFSVLIDMIAAYFSPDPLADQLNTSQDYQVFFEAVADYIRDDRHGIERLYKLVDQRQR